MQFTGMLSNIDLVIDFLIVAAFLSGVVGGWAPRRWRGTLMVLTLVALLNLAQSMLSMHEVPDAAFSADRLLHAGEVLALAATVFVFRREVLQPDRLLGRAGGKRSISDVGLDSVRAPVMTLTRDGVIRQVNKHAAEMFGKDAASLVGTDAFRLYPTREERKRVRQSFMRFVGSAGTLHGESENVLMTPKGERLIRWRRTAMLDRSGAVVGVVSYGEDVTEQRRAEHQLVAESYLLDSVHDAVTVRNRQGERVYFNRACYQMLGLERDEFRDLEPAGWLQPESVLIAERHWEAVWDKGDDIAEIVGVRKGGSPVPLELRSQRIEFDGQDCIMSVFRDMSSRHEAQDLMTQMAFTDSLTGLPNRRTMEARLAHALDRLALGQAKPSVLYLDVDNLKMVNDTLGHEAGDRLIKMVGERLGGLLREGDTVGRVGGDEFVIVLQHTSDAFSSNEVAQRLLDRLAEPLRLDGHELRLAASIGIVDCEPGTSAEDVIVSADRAMYSAKRAGGRRFVRHSPEMDEEVVDRFTLKNDLARALDNREFALHFQPIVDSASAEVIAAEALLRWTHPTRGMLGPDAFIDLAEQTGAIREIGRWVIESACAALVAWRGTGLALERVSVNVSPLQLSDERFVESVLATLEEHGLERNRLELEITETQAMEHTDEIESVFARLHAEGVRLALDDFGVGHSSLERLRRLPITTLKLDRTFVADLCTTLDAHPIIDTVLVLAKNLGLSVVAEGVETSCQAKYLREAGCRELQGYAFARPVEAEALPELADAPLRPSVCEHPERCRRYRATRAEALESA